MLGLSLTQPWATLMWGADKANETRDWPTSYRGDVAIVASLAFPKTVRAMCWEEPFRSTLERHGAVFSPKGPTGLPLGKVLCVVELYDCVRTSAFLKTWQEEWVGAVPPRPYEVLFGDYSEGRRGLGRYALLTRNLRRLAEPVPVEHLEKGRPAPGGALGLYKLSPNCEAAVVAQLAAMGK